MYDDEQIVDEVAEEIGDLERELDRLSFAEPKDEHQEAQIRYRREVSEKHLARLKALA